MDLRQLRHFIGVVETGSFSQTALKLKLTQSALSRSIQALERSLGIQLLDRVGKRSELTPLGRVVYERGCRAVLEADEIAEDLQRLQSPGQGHLSVGMGPWPSALLARPLMQHMAEKFPGMQLELRRGAAADQLADLRERKLDALVLDPRNIGSLTGLRLESVSDFRSVFLCRPQHPLATGEPVKFKELLQFPVLSSPFSKEAGRTLMSQYGEQGAPENLLSLSCEEWASMMEVACTTDTIHLGTTALAHELLRSGALIELPVVPKLKATVRVALVTLERRAEAPAVTIIRNFIHRKMCETESLVN